MIIAGLTQRSRRHCTSLTHSVLLGHSPSSLTQQAILKNTSPLIRSITIVAMTSQVSASEREVHPTTIISQTSPSKPRQKRAKARDTHFLCLPLVTETSVPQLSDSLSYFREITTPIPHLQGPNPHSDTDTDINSNSNSTLRIIPSKAHRPPGTFHLTLGVMDLSSPTKLQKATRLLQELDLESLLPEISSSSSSVDLPAPPLTISLSSLSAFPSASRARVFYAVPFDPTDRLHRFAVSIRQRWRAEGLITEGRPLVLHATVANLRYASGHGGGRGDGARLKDKGNENGDRGEVDARELIEVFDARGGHVDQNMGRGEEEGGGGGGEKYVWARDVLVDRLVICKLGAVKSEDEVWGLEYPPVAVKTF